MEQRRWYRSYYWLMCLTNCTNGIYLGIRDLMLKSKSKKKIKMFQGQIFEMIIERLFQNGTRNSLIYREIPTLHNSELNNHAETRSRTSVLVIRYVSIHSNKVLSYLILINVELSLVRTDTRRQE